MRICITFPTEKKPRCYVVKVRKGMTLDDIVDEILDQMLEEYKQVCKVKDEEAWREANERWLRLHVYTAILEALGVE